MQDPYVEKLLWYSCPSQEVGDGGKWCHSTREDQITKLQNQCANVKIMTL